MNPSCKLQNLLNIARRRGEGAALPCKPRLIVNNARFVAQPRAPAGLA